MLELLYDDAGERPGYYLSAPPGIRLSYSATGFRDKTSQRQCAFPPRLRLESG